MERAVCGTCGSEGEAGPCGTCMNGLRVVEPEPPIGEALDEFIPNWRNVAIKMKSEGYTDREIVEHFQSEMWQQLDALLDLYNDLGR